MLIQQFEEDQDEFMFDDGNISLIDADNEINKPIDPKDLVEFCRNRREQLVEYLN